MIARKGWVEVIWNGEAKTWDVYDWSEHHDSGACLGAFEDKQEAVTYAQAQAEASNRKMFEGVCK